MNFFSTQLNFAVSSSQNTGSNTRITFQKFHKWRTLNLFYFLLLLSGIAQAQNPIVTENALAGNPISEWGVPSFRDASINGFSTEIGVNKGQTVRFKINVQGAVTYTLQIYRIGYYGGNGARLVADLGTLAGIAQPAGVSDAVTGLLDCGNWTESAHWDIPATAVSGLYIAKLTRTGGGSNHIAFIVRDDASNADIYFQTPDASWQAYNGYGGNYLYNGTTSLPNGHASKVSYNRPIFPYNSGFATDGRQSDWYMNAEYPMIRWLERNGYNVSYTTAIDVVRQGNLILNHKIFVTSGHDEYWSKEQRDNVEAARNAGIHLAFFSGNEVYWKTRWENDVNGVDHRTLVCYKEGTLGDGSLGEASCGSKCDVSSPIWTGQWRSGGAYDAGRPENALTGQMSWDEVPGAIEVPALYKNFRFWKNTSVANLTSGQTATLAPASLGFEWDYEQYQSSYPTNRVTLSSTIVNNHNHKLALYRYSSGSLVFGAGTVQWAWGLDNAHFAGPSVISQDMQQATVNLFADMGAQPATRQPELSAATMSNDLTAPVSTITAPVNGASIPASSSYNITGTASDANNIALVEVSVDGGATWNAATGTTNWSLNWVPIAVGSYTIKSRAIDPSGNMEVVGAGPAGNVVTVNVTSGPPPVCPCTIFKPTDVASLPLFNDGQGVELGVKFQSSIAGYITGIRFYKLSGDGGTHTGELYNSTGTRLAQAVFTGETASGWQQVSFGTPVAITANTTYIAAYHSSAGNYTATYNYFASAVANNPLIGLADGTDGGNGVSVYSATPAFPITSNQKTNYSVDAVFNTTGPPVANAGNNQTITLPTTSVTLDGSGSLGNITSYAWTRISGPNTPAITSPAAVTTSVTGLIQGTYVFQLSINGGASTSQVTITVNASAPATTIFTTQTPTGSLFNDGQGIELGVKFRASVSGNVTGIRFYKLTGDGGTHTGELYSSTGTRLAQAVFTGETASGWQQVLFSTPVSITAGITYIAAYHSSAGNYAATNNFFTAAVTNGSLTGLADGTDGVNGIYNYSATPVFPTTSNAQKPNYWVDLMFNAGASVIANAGPNQTITLPTSTVTLDGSGSTGTISSYTWTRVSGPNTPTITAPNAVTTTVTGLVQGVYVFQLALNGGASASQVTITVNGAGVVANAGSNQTITLPTSTISLDGSASTGTISSYAWTRVSGPNTPTITTPAAVSTSVTGLIQGVYVFQLSLNGGASTSQVTITVNAAVAATTIFTNQVPAGPLFNDGGGIELGVKFRSSSAGNVTGIRFYKLTGDGGTHTGELYTSTGTRLAQAIFTGETASGWQQVLFTTPVAITAGTTYIAAYHSSAGNYVATNNYFVAGITNGALTGLADGTDGVNGVYTYSVTPLFPNISNNQKPNYWVDLLFNANATVAANAGANQSITLPTSTVTLDGSGSTGTISSYAWTRVSGPNTPTITSPTAVSTTVTGLVQGVYVFQLSVNGGASSSQVTITVNSATVVANAGNSQTITLPASSVTLDGSASTGAITNYAWTKISGPNTPVITSPSTATTTVTGLVQGVYVFQLSLNAGASTSQVTITVNPATTNTIFTNQIPAGPLFNDGGGIELGVKFRANVSGNVTGVRFYKLAGDGGTHTGELYSSTGTRLAQAVFAGESASGWQQILFSTPVAITAGTTYIAAYHSSAGNYTATNNYFTAGIVNGALTGLADGTDGVNGVYNYSVTPVFPSTSNGQKPNYWVDVMFNAGASVTANAGTNQTITLPTTTVTLDGSGSTGTISSYAWTRVSGPNTPTITTPTSVSTTVTGLVQGVYVFQLSINGGASTSQVTITVNAAGAVANAGINQTITLPTSTVTLDGSGSTGTISSYAWTTVSGPNTPTITTPAAVGTSVTGLVQGVYVFQLSINGGASTSQVTITVNAAGAVANAGTNQTITLPTSTVTLDGSGSTGTISSYAWTRVSGPNTPTITTPTTVSTAVTGLVQGVYVFQLSINGGASTSQVTITVNAAGAVANAGTNQTITLPTSTVTLNGSGSTGTISDYTWTRVSGPNTPTITTPTAVSTTVTGLINGVYVFQLSINGGASTSQVTITVNAAAVANAGTNQTITLPTSTVTLNGSASTGTITSYAWTRVSGPNTPTITTPTAVTTTVTGLIKGSYVFKLSINGGASTAQVTITVNPIPIKANAGPDQTITLPISTVTLNGSSSTGAITSYRWTKISGPGTPVIVNSRGVTTSVTGLLVGSYVFQLSVNSGVSTDRVTITVNPLTLAVNPGLISIDLSSVSGGSTRHNYNLGQNYPNPVSHNAKIRYSLPVTERVEIVLFDMQGKEIKMLVNEVKEPGTYIYDLDAGNLARGIYYYRMRSGKYSDVKRLMIQ